MPTPSPLKRKNALIGPFQLSFGYLFDKEVPWSEHLSASNCEGKGVKREESEKGGVESNPQQEHPHIFNGGGIIAVSKPASSELRYDNYDIRVANHKESLSQQW